MSFRGFTFPLRQFPGGLQTPRLTVQNLRSLLRLSRLAVQTPQPPAQAPQFTVQTARSPV